MKKKLAYLLPILVALTSTIKTDSTPPKPLLGIHCDQDGDCVPQNSYCDDASYRCRCKDDFYPANDKASCVQYAKAAELKNSCERDVGCKFINNSECSGRSCKCVEKYKQKNDKCKPITFANCTVKNDCPLQYQCIDGECSCKEGEEYSGYEDKWCPEYRKHLGKYCSLDGGCRLIPNSYCHHKNHDKKFCLCKSGYTANDNQTKCLADIEGDCPDDSHCRVDNSFCNDWQKCECEYGYFPSTDKKKCVKYELNGTCDQSDSCGNLQNTKCENNVCTCLPEAEIGSEGECWLPDTLPCQSPETCNSSDFSCTNSTCKCKAGFVQHNDSCFGFPGAKCSNASKCLSSAYICLHDSCILIEERKEKYSNCTIKNGTGTCWIEISKGLLLDLGVLVDDFEGRVCMVKHQDGSSVLGIVSDSEPKCVVHWSTKKESYDNYHLLINTRNLAWKKPYTLDNAVFGGSEGTQPFLICRTKVGTYHLGRLEPPRYRRCHVIGKNLFQSNYQVLTAEGSPCSSNNFTFADGICECSKGYYSYFGNCFKIPSRPNIPVDSSSACTHLKNTTYSAGKCICATGYYQVDDRCSKIPTDLDSCQDGCPPDSVCSEGFCHCQPGFVKFNGQCYGLPNVECSSGSKCISTSYTCQGICQKIEESVEGNQTCTGPICWIHDEKNNTAQGVVGETDQWGSQYVCRAVHGGLTIPGELRAKKWLRCLIAAGTQSISNLTFEMLVNNQHLAWTETYQLHQAVFGGTREDGNPYLVCRAQHKGLFYIGKLEPPLYESCYTAGDKMRVSSNFEVLVHTSDGSGTCKSDCGIDFLCSDGICQCRPGFLNRQGQCYGSPQAECSDDSRCLSTSFSCQSGKCLKVDDQCTEGLESSCWKSYDGMPVGQVTEQDGAGSKENVCRVEYEGLMLPGRHPFAEGFELCLVVLDDNVEAFETFDILVGGEGLGWMKSYTLDKAVSPGDSGNKTLIFCRTRVDGRTTIGNLAPPLYDLCYTTYEWEQASYTDFEVLVRK